jgi:hypothetical protein
MAKKKTYFLTNNARQGTRLIISKIILNNLIDMISISDIIMHFWGKKFTYCGGPLYQ